jgi:hypothetical protein
MLDSAPAESGCEGWLGDPAVVACRTPVLSYALDWRLPAPCVGVPVESGTRSFEGVKP